MSEDTRKYQVGGSHYVDMAIQLWDAAEEWMGHEQYVGYLRGSSIGYLARAGRKGPALEDYLKAMHYVQELCRVVEAYEDGA